MAENNSGDGLVAFLLGGVVGVVAGLLLAPRSGDETRERLAGWLEEGRDKAQDIFETGREKKDKLSAAWNAGKRAYRSGEANGGA